MAPAFGDKYDEHFGIHREDHAVVANTQSAHAAIERLDVHRLEGIDGKALHGLNDPFTHHDGQRKQLLSSVALEFDGVAHRPALVYAWCVFNTAARGVDLRPPRSHAASRFAAIRASISSSSSSNASRSRISEAAQERRIACGMTRLRMKFFFTEFPCHFNLMLGTAGEAIANAALPFDWRKTDGWSVYTQTHAYVHIRRKDRYISIC